MKLCPSFLECQCILSLKAFSQFLLLLVIQNCIHCTGLSGPLSLWNHMSSSNADVTALILWKFSPLRFALISFLGTFMSRMLDFMDLSSNFLSFKFPSFYVLLSQKKIFLTIILSLIYLYSSSLDVSIASFGVFCFCFMYIILSFSFFLFFLIGYRLK